MIHALNRDAVAEGATFALSHSVTVLDDAALLYSHKRAPGSFHLAVMAREELGRFNLLSKRYCELPQNATIEAAELAEYLEPHKAKLLAGQSIAPVPMPPEHYVEWQAAIARGDQSALLELSKKVRTRAAKLKPHQVAELHKTRLKAQYVDYDPYEGRWSRPSEVSMAQASTLIRTVMAEIANALIGAQSSIWLITAFAAMGESVPDMGNFTHRIFACLAKGEA